MLENLNEDSGSRLSLDRTVNNSMSFGQKMLHSHAFANPLTLWEQAVEKAQGKLPKGLEISDFSAASSDSILQSVWNHA